MQVSSSWRDWLVGAQSVGHERRRRRRKGRRCEGTAGVGASQSYVRRFNGVSFAKVDWPVGPFFVVEEQVSWSAAALSPKNSVD